MGTDVGWTGKRQAGRQAGKGSAGGSQRGRKRDRGAERERPSGLKSSIARIFAVTSRKSCDRPLVYIHPLCRASDTPPPLTPCFRATVRLRLYPSSFILRPQERWKTGDMHMAVSFLPPPFARPGYLIRAVLAAPRYSLPSSP